MFKTFIFVPPREMKPRELLNDFVSFLPSGILLEFHCSSSRLDAIPSDLGRPTSGEVPAESTLMLKSAKGVFDTRMCTVIMTFLFLLNVCFNGLT